MSKYDVKCEIFKADFSDEKEAQKLIPEVNSIFKINCLVNNASIFYENSFLEKGTPGLSSFFVYFWLFRSDEIEDLSAGKFQKRERPARLRPFAN